MTEYAITPYEGAGDIRLGMLREDVRKLFTEQPVSRYKTPDSLQLYDSFMDAGVVCYYDAAGACKAIEFLSGSKPTYDGKSLLGMKLVAAVKLLNADKDIQVMDDRTVQSAALGIGLFFRLKKVASAIMFVKGYYDAAKE